MFIPRALWTCRLRAYAAFVNDPHILAVRFGDIHRLAVDSRARDRFVQRWRVWLEYFRQCERNPGWFVRDPELLDATVLDLWSYARFADRTTWSGLHRLLDEVVQVAERTRVLRQQLYAIPMRPTMVSD